jgi:TPR repeat protein
VPVNGRNARYLILFFFLALCAACSDDETTSSALDPTSGSGNNIPDLAQLRGFADAGDAGAQFALGMIYATGDGVTTDRAVALDWMEKAAAQGHMQAQYEPGSYYILDHPARDFGKAAHWLRLSALQGYASAQISLGILYAAGRGVPRDFAEAFAWLSLAEALGQDPLAIESKRKVEQLLTQLSLFHQVTLV